MKAARAGRVALTTILVVMLLGGSASGISIIIPTVSWTTAVVEGNPAVSEDTPVIDGKLIAWEDADGVKVKNLATGEIRRVPDGGGLQHEPDVSGDRVVYQDDTSGNWDIKVYSWSANSASTVVDTADDEINPRIDGNYVIWFNDGATAGEDNLWMRSYDMAGGTVKLTQGHPNLLYDVDNGRVAMVDLASNRLYLRTLRPYGEWIGPVHAFSETVRRVEAHGDRVVVGLFDGASDNDVVYYDIPTDTVNNVAVDGAVNEAYPTIFHNTVAWSETGTGDDDIGYEWVGGLFFVATPAFGSAVENDWSPSLFGNRCVFEQTSGGDLNIVLGTSNTKLVSRTSGTSRYGTAAAVSAAYFTDATNVVLCNGLNFPDALSAAPLAKALDAPLLLTAPGSLPPETLTEITRLAPSKVWIIGGTSAISKAIYDQLDVSYNVERVSGNDRYETSAAIARRMMAITGAPAPQRAFFARGDAFPDALAVGPVASAAVAPIMLVKPTSVPPAIADAFDDLDITQSYVIGGSGVVSDGVYNTLRDLEIANGGIGTIERWAGGNRYATAAEVAKNGAAYRWIDLDTVGFAIGTNFPDALGGGAALGHYGSALLLTNGTSLSAATAAFLDAHKYEIGRIDCFGGKDVLTDSVKNAIVAKIY